MKKLFQRLKRRNRSEERVELRFSTAEFQTDPLGERCHDVRPTNLQQQNDQKSDRMISIESEPSRQLQQEWIPSAREIEQLRQMLLKGDPLPQLKRLIISYKKTRRVTAASFSPEGLSLVLLEASRRGRADVLIYLLNKYRPCIAVNQLIDSTPVGLMSCELMQRRSLRKDGVCCTYTLLHVATGALATDCLIRNGAIVDIPNCCGDTPLHLAVRRFVCENNGHLKVRLSDKTTLNSIRSMVNAGADVNSRNLRGETPLMTAVEEATIFKPLFSVMSCSAAHLDLNAVNKRGFTALHLASSPEIVQILLESGANPHFKAPCLSHDYIPCPLYIATAKCMQSVQPYLIHPLCTTAFKIDAMLIKAATTRLNISSVPMYREYTSVQEEWQNALELASHCDLHTHTSLLLSDIKSIVASEEVRSNRGLDMAVRIMEVFIGKNHPHMVSCYHKAHWLCNKSYTAHNYLMKAAQLLLYQLQSNSQHPLTANLVIMRELLQAVFASYMSLLDYCYRKGILVEKACYEEFLIIAIQILTEYDRLACGHFHCYYKLDDVCARCLFWCFNRWLTVEPHSEECKRLGKEFVNNCSSLFHSTLLEIALRQYPPFHFSSLTLIQSLLQWGAASSLNQCLHMQTNKDPAYLLHAVLLTRLDSQLPRSEVVSLLLRFGAHLDTVDHRGRTCYSVCSDPEVGSFLRSQLPLPLSCLASNAIIAHGIQYQQAPLPKHIKELVSYHDRSRVQPSLVSSTEINAKSYHSLHRLMYNGNYSAEHWSA